MQYNSNQFKIKSIKKSNINVIMISKNIFNILIIFIVVVLIIYFYYKCNQFKINK